ARSARSPRHRSSLPLPRLLRRRFLDELVAVRGVEVELVDLAELRDLPQRSLAERGLPLEDVQEDALQEVADGEIVELGQAFEDLEDSLLDADAGLGACDCYHGTSVPRSRSSSFSRHTRSIHSLSASRSAPASLRSSGGTSSRRTCTATRRRRPVTKSHIVVWPPGYESVTSTTASSWSPSAPRAKPRAPTRGRSRWRYGDSWFSCFSRVKRVPSRKIATATGTRR